MTRTLRNILHTTLLSGALAAATAFAYPAASSSDEARHVDFLQWEVGHWSTDITKRRAWGNSHG